MSQRFPIQSLPPLEVSELEHQASKQVMQQLLAHTLREFEFHSYHNSGIVDARRWKPHTYRDDIELYRERKTGVTGNSVFSSLRHCRLDLPLFSSTIETLASPTMLLTGYGQGRVEDAMSAVVTESQHDLALAVKFKHQDVADCAILKTLEPPTQSEPYHYLGYKFFVRKSPTEGLLFKHRHSVYLEFSGITRSSKGEQLGFHIMHSVELPQFPDLSDYNSIRAVQSTRYIYRQKSTHVVEVFMLGNMDISGRMLKPLANMFTVDVFFGVTRLLELAEVRRLSQMARRQRNFGVSTAVLGSASACTGCNRSDFKHKMPKCHLCGKTTCKKCAVTKRVFVGDDMGILGDFVKVPACRACVRRANTGSFVSPHERVLRTPDDKLNFDFRKPKVASKPKMWSKPAETKRSELHPTTRRETYPSGSPSKPEPLPGQYSSSVPMNSKFDQQEDEDIVAPRLNRRWTKPTPTDKSYSDRGFRHIQAEPPARPRARTRVSIPAQGDGLIYGAPPPKTRASVDPQIPSTMSPAERAIMTRLFELSKIAEDTSATARLNGIYCEQHWREELKMEVEASRSQVRRRQSRDIVGLS
ncbi:L-2-hydroxyglutarate dehydrogenase [Phytophthora cinnamomi]|uniref:L-2-hydroxyglutarate dehydrogenase n=1 Tax=Phytophthora cinnamomi TaxID=4785 RepID=UPI003559AFCA|nr:L-2-hydroxyglutarate dehydrogenase [Phytophthora cinnamomi]